MIKVAKRREKAPGERARSPRAESLERRKSMRFTPSKCAQNTCTRRPVQTSMCAAPTCLRDAPRATRHQGRSPNATRSARRVPGTSSRSSARPSCVTAIRFNLRTSARTRATASRASGSRSAIGWRSRAVGHTSWATNAEPSKAPRLHLIQDDEPVRVEGCVDLREERGPPRGDPRGHRVGVRAGERAVERARRPGDEVKHSEIQLVEARLSGGARARGGRRVEVRVEAVARRRDEGLDAAPRVAEQPPEVTIRVVRLGEIARDGVVDPLAIAANEERAARPRSIDVERVRRVVQPSRVGPYTRGATPVANPSFSKRARAIEGSAVEELADRAAGGLRRARSPRPARCRAGTGSAARSRRREPPRRRLLRRAANRGAARTPGK